MHKKSQCELIMVNIVHFIAQITRAKNKRIPSFVSTKTTTTKNRDIKETINMMVSRESNVLKLLCSFQFSLLHI